MYFREVLEGFILFYMRVSDRQLLGAAGFEAWLEALVCLSEVA